jgi:hypothetical protein
VILLSECPGVRPSTDWLTDWLTRTPTFGSRHEKQGKRRRRRRNAWSYNDNGYEPKGTLGALSPARGEEHNPVRFDLSTMKFEADEWCVAATVLCFVLGLCLAFWIWSRTEGRLYWRPGGTGSSPGRSPPRAASSPSRKRSGWGKQE